MKNLLSLCLLIFAVSLGAQTDVSVDKTPLIKLSPKLTNTLSQFSVTATAGTSSFAVDALNTATAKDLLNPNLAQLTISYKMNPRISFGISSMNGLSNAASGFYNAENVFESFCDDDDDDDEFEDDDDDDDLDDDDDDDDHDDDDDDDCDDDEGLGQNLMGGVTFKLSEKLPFFVQAAAGYSFGSKAPAYTAMIGYNQKIFAGFGIMAGVRYSDVLHQLPAGAESVVSPAGLKVELGASWNF